MAATVRNRVGAWSETVSDLVVSAGLRFEDAQELLAAGRFHWACYSFGLASEMWLKSACYFATGCVASDRVAVPRGRIESFLLNESGLPSKESGHSLAYWSAVLVRYRRSLAAPMSRTLQGNLLHHVDQRLFEGWGINMRYRPVGVDSRDALRMFSDAAWLARYHRDLWR